jgi:hypothetical protein
MELIANILAVVFSALWVLNITAKLFRGRKPSEQFNELVALAAKLGVTVSVGKPPTAWLRHAAGAYNPKRNAIWCRRYLCSILWHELTHALQHHSPEWAVDAAGLRLLLQENGLRCWFLPLFIFAFNIFYSLMVVLRVYQPRHYRYELLAYFCQWTRVGKKLVYRKIASL